MVVGNVESGDGGTTLAGNMTYSGEGPIGFKSELSDDAVYSAENQWGGSFAPWHQGGIRARGCCDQDLVAVDITSNDSGKTFTGSMTYAREAPTGVRASAVAAITIL